MEVTLFRLKVTIWFIHASWQHWLIYRSPSVSYGGEFVCSWPLDKILSLIECQIMVYISITKPFISLSIKHWLFLTKAIPVVSLWLRPWDQGGCFTNVSRALQNNLAKIHNARNHSYVENFKLKFCTRAQSMALGTRAKFQHAVFIRSTISAIYTFRENIMESSRNVSETTPNITAKW